MISNHEKVWKVYLPNKEVIIHAQWVKNLDDGYVIFGYGDVEMPMIVGKFIENNICGYTLVGGTVMYMDSSIKEPE